MLLEDFGALMGLVLALVGVSVAAATGDSRWDAYATIAIGVLLVMIAAVLAFEMKSLLIGESAREPVRKQIVQAIEGSEGVVAVLDMRTQHIGPDQLLVAAELKMDPDLDTAGMTSAIDRRRRVHPRGGPHCTNDLPGARHIARPTKPTPTKAEQTATSR